MASTADSGFRLWFLHYQRLGCLHDAAACRLGFTAVSFKTRVTVSEILAPCSVTLQWQSNQPWGLSREHLLLLANEGKVSFQHLPFSFISNWLWVHAGMNGIQTAVSRCAHCHHACTCWYALYILWLRPGCTPHSGYLSLSSDHARRDCHGFPSFKYFLFRFKKEYMLFGRKNTER